MPESTTQAKSFQEVTSTHPTMFDKWLWSDQIHDESGLSFGAMAVAQRLAHHHNEHTGQCNPSLQTIARKLGSSLTAIKRYLNELREAGYVDWKTGRNHDRNSYTLSHIRIHGPKGSDVPAYDVPPVKPRPARKRKDPASPSEGNVVQFPAPKAVSDPASVDQSVVVSSPGSIPEAGSCNSPISGSRYSPISGSKYLKGNPSRGYTEEEVVEGNETEAASVSPASPLCLDGDGPSMAGEDEKRPDQQPEPVSQLADGKLSFDQLSPEWKARAREWAEGQFQGDKTFIDQASRGFKPVAIERGWRLTEDRWQQVWMAYSMQERSKIPSKPRPKNQPPI